MGLLNSIEGRAWDPQQNNRIFFPGRLHLSLTTRKTDGSHWGCFSKGSVQGGHCREFLTAPWSSSNACPSIALVTQQFHGLRKYQNSSYKVLTCWSQKELVSIANHWAPTWGERCCLLWRVDYHCVDRVPFSEPTVVFISLYNLELHLRYYMKPALKLKIPPLWNKTKQKKTFMQNLKT